MNDPSPPRTGGHVAAVVGLFFVSGFAALVYQVLWVRELGLLFGSTAESAAVAIAIFFAGIASGGWFWGRRSASARSPLRRFGLLEIGVAVTAFGHFAVVGVYHRLYPALHEIVGAHPTADLALKALVASTLLLPPAFLMGGTLPMMGQHLVALRGGLGTTGAAIYAVNTAGSAAGALAAGFVLPPLLGFRSAYLVAIGLDLTVGVIAVALARRPVAHTEVSARPADTHAGAGATERASAHLPGAVVWAVALVSGIVALAVEVVWTRLFAQVLQNSAYTYSIVLTTFLVALAGGAAIANRLARLPSADPTLVLAGLLTGAGLTTAASPWLFHRLTDGASYVGDDRGWAAYVVAVAGLAVVTMGLPALALGTVLPYLLRMLQHVHRSPGEVLGRLVATNTIGAIAGALAGGFVVLPLLGPWSGLALLAAPYPATAAVVLATRRRAVPRSATRLVPTAACLGLVVAGLAMPTGALTDSGVVRPGERLVESVTGPQANVAVVVDGDDELAIRVNTTYTLGGTRGLHAERDQAMLPLLVHPDPRSVFFLGMGTGLTAGAALSVPVEHLVVCELIGDVVELSRAHFGRWTNGLFDDPRVTVVVEDGRNCLSRSAERYDVIISDLFVPWEAGTGNLYTLEHYRIAHDRLQRGGVYVQWIPLYQVSDRELGIIARTMDEVFDEVVAWRGDLFPSRSVLALVGHRDATPLDPTVIAPAARSVTTAPIRSDAQLEAMVLRHYVGNITRSGIYATRDLNTDSRPRIEYLTPRTHREVRAGRATFVVGDDRERLYRDLATALPPADDPYLTDLDERGLLAVESGRIYSRYRYAAWRDDPAAAGLLDQYRTVSPPRATADISASRVLLPRVLDGS